MKKSSWHYTACSVCGATVLTQAVYKVMCHNCAKLHTPAARIAEVRKKNPKFNTADPDNLFIVRDPLPIEEGGLKKGTPIPRLQVEYMCTYGTFSDNTILQDRNGKRYEILRDFSDKQQLVLVRP